MRHINWLNVLILLAAVIVMSVIVTFLGGARWHVYVGAFFVGTALAIVAPVFRR